MQFNKRIIIIMHEHNTYTLDLNADFYIYRIEKGYSPTIWLF